MSVFVNRLGIGHNHRRLVSGATSYGKERETSAQRHRFLHRPAALGYDRHTRQSAGPDARTSTAWRAGTDAHHSFTCQPVCGPARACLQTGLYATETGCYRNGIALPEDNRTLAHYFGEAGYDTAYIGKWHLADSGSGPVPPEQRGGYQYWLASNILEFTSDAYDLVMYDGDEQARKLPGYRVDAQTDAAIRYIDSHQANPFFLFLSFLEPHHQNHRDDYPAPVGYAERYRGRWIPPDLAALGGSAHQHLAGYLGIIKRLDEALGRLIDALI